MSANPLPKLLLCCLPGLLGAFQSGPADAAETLEQAWATAVASDHGQAAMHADTEAARADQRATRALRWPTVQAEATELHVNKPPQVLVQLPAYGISLPITADRNVGLGGVIASVPLFTSGRISHAIGAARAGLVAAQSQERGSNSELRLQVARRYFDVLRAQHLLVVMDDAQASLEAHARDVGNLYAKGYVPRKDLLGVQVMLADVSQQVRESRNRLDLADAAYNRQLDRPLDTPVHLVDRGPSGHVAGDLVTLTREAMAQREELKAFDSAARANDNLAASKRAENLPSLALVGGYARWDSSRLGSAGSWVVGATLNWKFFDGGRTRAEASHYTQLAVAAREREQEARSLIRLDVRRAWLSLHDTNDRMHVAHDALGAARENLRVARSRYREGLGTNADVLDAERENSAAETRYYLARYAAAYAEIDLERATGNL